MRHMEEGGLSRAILELVGDAGLCRLDRPPERESSQDVAFVDRGLPCPSFRRKDAGLPSELEASSNLRLDSRPAAEPSGQMLDSQKTLEHGGSRRCDPHPEIVIEGHSGPADVLCQVESKAEDKVAAVTFTGVSLPLVGGPRGGLFGRRGGTVSPWDDRPSEVVPSSSWPRHAGGPEEGCGNLPTLDACRQPAPLSRKTGFRWRCGRARSRRTPAMRVGSASPETCEAFGRLSESVSGGPSGRACTACRNDGRAGGAGLRWSPGCKVSTTR